MNPYLPIETLLNAREEVMRQLLETEMTWGDKLRAEGIEKGIEKGRQEGKLVGERTLLLQLLKLKFGPLPDDLVQRINGVNDETILYALGQQMLQAKTLSDIVLPTPATKTNGHSSNATTHTP